MYLDSSSKTTAGVWISNGSPMACDQNDIEVLGRLISLAMIESREGVSHPTKWKTVFEPMLRLAGVKSFSVFVKAAKCVEIVFDHDEWIFTPTINRGSDQGFEPVMNKAVRITHSEPTILAQTLLSTFNHSE